MCVHCMTLVQPLSQRRVVAHETGNAAHVHGYPRARPVTAVPTPQAQSYSAEAVIKLGVRSTHSSCRVRRNTCCCSCLSLLPKPPPPPPLAPGDATVNIASASNVSRECPRGTSGGGNASFSTGANCCVVRARAKAFVSSGKASFDFDVDAGLEDRERFMWAIASGVVGA